MYRTIRDAGMARVARQEALPGLGAWVLAESFYKFHSFTLELFAFMATWVLLSWLSGHLFRAPPSSPET